MKKFQELFFCGEAAEDAKGFEKFNLFEDKCKFGAEDLKKFNVFEDPREFGGERVKIFFLTVKEIQFDFLSPKLNTFNPNFRLC